MKNQLATIRSMFISRQNQWIPLYEIMGIAAQYNARIYSLRQEGMAIINKTKIYGGVKHSWYKNETLREEENGQLKII